MTTLVRMNLQLTEDEAAEVANLLESKLRGILPAFEGMIDQGTAHGTHYDMMYRSERAQQQFTREGQG